MRKTKEAEAFERRCTAAVADMLAARGFASLPRNVGWDFYVTWFFPKLVNKGWQEEGKGERWNRKDNDGPIKLMLDSVFRAIAENDAANTDLHVRKRDGHGSAFAQFVLQERELMPETPNTTELAQEVNSRESGVRVSPEDPPALVDYYATQQKAYCEVRMTAFDMWRYEIMTRVLQVFDKVQHNLDCPARTGVIDACFGCTDMMVINCIMSNPLTTNDKGVLVGMFDLCEARKGFHLRRVDREGGEMSETPQSEIQDAQSYVIAVIQQFLHIDEHPLLALDVINTAHDLIKTYKGHEESPAQEALLRVGVLLTDAAATKCPNPLPKPGFWYKDITTTNVPAEYREGIKEAASLWSYALSAFKTYRQQYIDWKEAGGAKPATEAAPAAEAPKRSTKLSKKGKSKKTEEGLRPGDLPADDAVAAPVAAATPAQLPLPMPGASLPVPGVPVGLPDGLGGAVPYAVVDASIPGPPPPGMPKMQPIVPQTPTPATTVLPHGSTVTKKSGPPKGEETIEGVSNEDILRAILELTTMVKENVALTEKVNGNLKKLAGYFANTILPEIKKSGSSKKK